jgi:Lon protease-like protein
VHTIQRTGCAALVTDVTANPDGSFEILVVGRRRFHVESLDPTQDYLRAAVEWLPDSPGGSSPDDLSRAARTARTLFDAYRTTIEELRGDDVLEGDSPTDPVDLSYTLAAALVLTLAQRQTLLEAPDVITRLRLGTSMMRAEIRAIKAIASLPATSLVRTQWSAN